MSEEQIPKTSRELGGEGEGKKRRKEKEEKNSSHLLRLPSEEHDGALAEARVDVLHHAVDGLGLVFCVCELFEGEEGGQTRSRLRRST